MADNNEKQIEDNVKNTCDHKICKRALRISVCAEHTVTEVENSESRHTERIDAEIKHRALNKIVFRAEQLQHKPRRKKTKYCYDTARYKAYHKGGTYGSRCTRFIPRAEMMCNLNVDGIPHSDEESREKRYKDRG